MIENVTLGDPDHISWKGQLFHKIGRSPWFGPLVQFPDIKHVADAEAACRLYIDRQVNQIHVQRHPISPTQLVNVGLTTLARLVMVTFINIVIAPIGALYHLSSSLYYGSCYVVEKRETATRQLFYERFSQSLTAGLTDLTGSVEIVANALLSAYPILVIPILTVHTTNYLIHRCTEIELPVRQRYRYESIWFSAFWLGVTTATGLMGLPVVAPLLIMYDAGDIEKSAACCLPDQLHRSVYFSSWLREQERIEINDPSYVQWNSQHRSLDVPRLDPLLRDRANQIFGPRTIITLDKSEFIDAIRDRCNIESVNRRRLERSFVPRTVTADAAKLQELEDTVQGLDPTNREHQVLILCKEVKRRDLTWESQDDFTAYGRSIERLERAIEQLRQEIQAESTRVDRVTSAIARLSFNLNRLSDPLVL